VKVRIPWSVVRVPSRAAAISSAETPSSSPMTSSLVITFVTALLSPLAEYS